MTLDIVVGVVLGVVASRIWSRTRKPSPIIHRRDGLPWPAQATTCDYTGWDGSDCRREALFKDSRGLDWCRVHLNRATGAVEQSTHRTSQTTGSFLHTGQCVVHGIDCPKPWAPIPPEKETK